MRTACLICILLLGICQPVFTQNGKWKNAYEHYRGFYGTENSIDFWYGFDGEFQEQEIGFSILLERNVYIIKVRIAEKVRDSIVWREKKYDGFYTVSEEGELCLLDQHPFTSNCFRIKEKMYRRKRNKFIQNLYFTARFSKEFERFSSKKQIANNEYSYNPPNEKGESSISYTYFPAFFPDHHAVLPEQMDSIQKKVLSDGYADTVSIRNYRRTRIPGSEALVMYIDSMRFDTVYVSNCYLSGYRNQGSSRFMKFDQVLKLNYRSFHVRLAEGSELFETPLFSAPIRYVREEIDVLSDLKITDFHIDRYGIYWVRIELDKYDSSLDTHTYPSGWVMQNLLFSY